MPNPLRDLAGGEPLYTSWISVFKDDVSGNRSKQWNKHINIYTRHSNIPRSLLSQGAYLKFLSTSPNASATEQMFALRELSACVKHPFHLAVIYSHDTGNISGKRKETLFAYGMQQRGGSVESASMSWTKMWTTQWAANAALTLVLMGTWIAAAARGVEQTWRCRLPRAMARCLW
jgi:hypothetical protein